MTVHSSQFSGRLGFYFLCWLLFCLLLQISSYTVCQCHASDGEGLATISPSESIVGATQDYQITFTTGASGLNSGGFIRVDLPSCSSFHGLPPILNWSLPQIRDDAGEGFVSVAPAHKFNVVIEPVDHVLSNNFSYRIKLVATTRILSGETVTVYFSKARSQRLTQSCFFPVYTDTDADGKGKIISDFPNVTTVGGEPKNARIVLPSIVGLNDQFDVKVVVLDQFGFPCDNYTGTVLLKTNAAVQNLPRQYTFTANENATHVFENVSFLSKGVFTVNVSNSAITADSNPCAVIPRSPVSKLYWGDLHWHSNFSDGTRSPAEGYRYARNVTFLDFSAMTDHDNFLDFKNLWLNANRISSYFHDPGDFVTFSAYEWTSPSAAGGGFGHRNVYYLRDGESLFPYTDPANSTPDMLWEHLQGRYAVTIPHHTAEENTSVMDWSYYNEDMQPLGEIYSGHGNSEREGGTPSYYGDGRPGCYIQDALAMDHKLGFIASTDSHLTLPGGNDVLATYRGHRHSLPALAAVYAPFLSRGALLKQMKKRHTYATTGKRVILLFFINDTAFMGDELSTTAPPHISIVAVGGKSVIDKIELIRDNEIVLCVEENTSVSNVNFEDEDFFSFSSGSTHYYYVRVTLTDQFYAEMPGGMQSFPHMAWSSPIWVTKD